MKRAGSPRSREWFRDWFGEEYLALYPHRDDKEAGQAVRLFLRAVPPDGLVLDLACGAGRHARELSVSGVPVIGLDLSSTLLGEARKAEPDLSLVRADMRDLPFADCSFGGLTSFFTSFGYFGTQTEDRRVIDHIRRVLAPGGTFMLDFFNATRVREQLVPHDVRWFEDQRVTQTRDIEGDMVVKRIVIEPRDLSSPVQEFEERVRLYDPAELDALLREARLETEYTFGDYGGADFVAGSERLILAGRAV